MKKITKRLIAIPVLIFSIAGLSVVALFALLVISVVFIWIGDIGHWYFTLSAPIQIISSIAFAIIYLIGSMRQGAGKRFIKQ
jgi:uncharacterized RDD family membrane protein YckC